MPVRIIVAFLLTAALAASAQAQSFDGTYAGTRTITYSRSAQGGPQPNCPGVGGKRTSITFKVAGGAITLQYLLRRDALFTGRIGPGGNFTITAPWPPGSQTSVTWSGRIEGRRLRGELVGTGPGGGVCRGTLSARKRS
jgi:hypothetical protein